MNIELRRARAEDAVMLAVIEAQWPTAPGWGKKGISSEIENPGSCVFVGESEGKTAGFIAARFLVPEAEIISIAVERSFVRKGIGRSLLEYLIREAWLRKCAKVHLDVDVENKPAIDLYASAGFKIVGRRPKFYNGTRDALLMTLESGVRR